MGKANRAIKCGMVWKVNNCNNLVTAPEFVCAAGHHMAQSASPNGALEMMRQIESTRGMLADIENEIAQELAEQNKDPNPTEYSVLVPEQILLSLCMELDIPFVLTSPAGRGKTATIKSIAEDLEMNIIEVQASSADAMDIAGRPTNQVAELDTDDFGRPLQTLVSVAPDWMRKWSSDKPNMVFFDEVDKAAVDVQNALLKLFDERVLNTGDKLPKGTLIAAAGNFTADSGAEDFTTALISRMVPIAWMDEATSEDEESIADLLKVRKEGRESNFQKRFPAMPYIDREQFKHFLGVAQQAREQYISTQKGIDLDTPDRNTIKESYDSSNLSNFATDRTWLMAERLLAYHDAMVKADPSGAYASHKDAVRSRIINGTIGKRRGLPYLTIYRNQVNIPTMADLIKDPFVFQGLSPDIKTVVKTQLENNLLETLQSSSSSKESKIQILKDYVRISDGITGKDKDSIDSFNFGSNIRTLITGVEIVADNDEMQIIAEAKRRLFAVAGK